MAWIRTGWQNGWGKNLLAAVVIAVAVLAAYANSFSGPFVFDDEPSIIGNARIRSLWPLWPVMEPIPGGSTVGGRPVLNLSFAFNYAAGGLEVWGYHVVNTGIHLLAGLLLYGFVRRTLLRPSLRERFGTDATWLALTVAVLWVLHPLQTEAVTYIVQRAESLAALFYLLALYCFVRSVEGENEHRGWKWAAVLACAIGMGCKETMVSAPLMVWLYDRTLVAGTFREALARRWSMYGPMAATWLLLAYFILAAGERGSSTEMGLSATTLGYAQTQCYAIVKYLGLVFWPHPLVFDYGTPIIKEPLKIILPGLLLLALGLATIVGVWRRTFFGFLLCWFFAVLAPSSSIVAVVTQTMAEHRMYLPLAAVLILVVLSLYCWMGRWSLALWVVAAVTLGGLTSLRNRDYRTAFSIWEDTVQKCPANARALGNLGNFSLREGQTRRAKELSIESIRLNPNYLEPRMSLGIILCQEGHIKEGIQQFRYAVQINPNNVGALTNLGMALYGAQEWKEAQEHFEEVLRLEPGNALVKRYLTYVKVKGADSK